MKLKLIVFAALAVNGSLMSQAQASTTLLSADFNSNNGGFTASTIDYFNGGAPVAGWGYTAAAGVANSGGWSTNSEGVTDGQIYEHLLTSSLITLTSSSNVNLSFDHYFDFESGWDGGMINVSVNGGSFDQIPVANFTQNAYSGIIQVQDQWGNPRSMNGKSVFTGASGADIFETSQANLGSFSAGDTLQIQFDAGFDWNGSGIAGDNSLAWAIDNVTVTSVPLPAAVWLFGSAVAGIGAIGRRKIT